MIEMIEIDISKIERGTRTGNVKVTRDGKSFYRKQRVGKKDSPRKGTGKIASLPQVLRNEIIELRKLGYSGNKIKAKLESMITFEVPTKGETREKLNDLREKSKVLHTKAAHIPNYEAGNEYRIEAQKLLAEEFKITSKEKGDLKLHIDSEVSDRDLVSEGVITSDGKLTMTGQSLVDWAKARGIESTKKRKTVESVEIKAKRELDTQFKTLNDKLSRVSTENMMLKKQLKQLQEEKNKTNKLRSTLNNENYILRQKLKTAEGKGD